MTNTTEPMRKQIDAAYEWYARRLSKQKLHYSIGAICAQSVFLTAYVNHVPAAKDAQIARLETGMTEQRKIMEEQRDRIAELEAEVEELEDEFACNDWKLINCEAEIEAGLARIAELGALTAWEPISDKHKDGAHKLACIHEMRGHWAPTWGWVGDEGLHIFPTHAATLLPPSAKEGEK